MEAVDRYIKIHVFLYLIISNYLHWVQSCIHAFNNRKIFSEQPYATNPGVYRWRLPNDMFAYMFFVSQYRRGCQHFTLSAFSVTCNIWLYCDCGLVVMKTPLWHLTHWGRVTYICVGKLTIIGSDNGLSPAQRRAIIWTNAGILLIGLLGTNCSEILIGIQTFSFAKMHLKMSSAKWRPFCLCLNVFKHP